MMKIFTPSITAAILVTSISVGTVGTMQATPHNFDLYKLRYKIDSPSVFHNRQAQEMIKMNSLLTKDSELIRKTAPENPEPIFTLPPSTTMGNMDAPGGQLWYFTGEFEYETIPPHDDVAYTDYILQEYTFKIYDEDMKLIGTVKDKMDYAENEVRVPSCELTPVATRNFFNTDDSIEVIVALAVNREEGGNNYRSVVYALDGKKDAEGFDQPISIFNDLVGDVVEGPLSPDGKDNFYITFMNDNADEVEVTESFWDYLLSQKANIGIYGKALDNKGPRLLHSSTIPLIQLPGDQEDVPPLISMVHNDKVIYSISYYKEPFYNRYENPLEDDMTMREGNSLIIDMYYATEEKIEKYSSTEIEMQLDPMPDASGNPTALFSYYSVGSLRYTGDFLFDAPGVTGDKPDFLITKGNYQISKDGTTNSYYVYKNNGKISHTLFTYADGTREMGDLPGCEPQQLFVSSDSYGYVFNFVDIYSGKTASKIDADYYYDEDSDPELLTTNVGRTPAGDSYKYVFELRYPVVDDDENDILRFMYINADGSYDHTEYVNMGKNVVFAQSFISTAALAPHAYTESDVPAFMFLVKRGIDGSTGNIEEIMVAEATSEENPEGKTLLLLGPDDQHGNLASIVPEFPEGDGTGRLFIYYYDNDTNKYFLDIYLLPLDKDLSGVENIPAATASGISNEEMEIFSLDGRLVASDAARIGSLGKGIYIVKTAGKTYKIAR